MPARLPRAAYPLATPFLISATLLATAFAVAPAAADDGPSGRDLDATAPPPVAIADEIVVTANHTITARAASGSSVTVIDRAEIERRGEPTVLELLRTVAGLEVVQGGGDGRLASVFLRGGSSAQTLVLIDGVRVGSPADGAFDFAALATAGIERIEVLRGPQSGLYGSEAMGGVVAIYTRDGGDGGGADRRAATATLEAGSRDSRRGTIDLVGGARRLRWALAVARGETDGVSAASEAAGNTEADGWRNTTVAGRAGWDLGGGGSADLTLRWIDDESEFDGFGFDGTAFVPSDDPNSLQLRDSRLVSLSLRRPLTGRWTQVVTAGVHDEELAGEDPDSPFQRFHFDSRVEEVGTRADLELSADDALSVGVGHEERAMENVGSFDEEVTLGSAYAQYRRQWRDLLGAERLHATAALRHDHHSTFGGETTWRLTMAGLRGASRLHGSWGTGFRAPTFFDLFSPFGANPDLAPETSEGGDLGFERRFGDPVAAAGARGATVDVTLFHNAYRDLIVLDERFVPQNVARALSRGVEATVDASFGARLGLAGSYTWTDTEDRADGEPLPRRPEHRATLSLLHQPSERLRGSLTAVGVAGRVDTGGAAMDDYLRLDLLLRYRSGPRLEPFLRIDNLLDADYEELAGFTTPGFSLFAGVRATL